MGRAPERRLLIVAGEPSADAHAARLVRTLNARGRWHVRGVTGPALESAGAGRLVPMDTLAVIGFSGVVRRLPALWGAMRALERAAVAERPDAAVLVDAPGFNFRLGPKLKRRGIPVFYYIAPQVWAWHPERAAEMAAWVDRLAVVFPFEEPLFRAAGVNATFVGHPLLDGLEPEVDGAALRAELGVPGGARLLGLLPGSRPQEVRAHLPILLAAARRLRRDRPDLVTVVALAPGVGEPELAAAGWRADAGEDGVRVVRERTRSVQAHADACAVASGTATLETALFGTPLAIVYRVGALNYAIARRLVTLKRIGLPNIVAEDEVAPELIQDAFTPAAVAEALAPWLDDPVARERAHRRLAVVRDRLGAGGASERAADLLEGMLP